VSRCHWALSKSSVNNNTQVDKFNLLERKVQATISMPKGTQFEEKRVPEDDDEFSKMMKIKKMEKTADDNF
jgi:hypothetical protein